MPDPADIPSSSPMPMAAIGDAKQVIQADHAIETLLDPVVRLRVIYLVLAIVAALATYAGMRNGTRLPREAAFMGGILVSAAIRWRTQALPLFATSIAVIGLQVLLLANPGEWGGLGFESGTSPPYTSFLAIVASPI